MDRYTNLNLYGHLALELGSDNNSGGPLSNVPTSDISFLRFTGNNPVVNGLDPGYGANNNKVLIITFLGTGSLTFKHLSGLNSSNNFRIKTPNGEDYIVPVNYGSILIYDSYDNFWHIVGEAKLAAGSNGEIQFNNNGSLKGSPNFNWDINNNILNVSGTIYSTALFDNGKRVATLTGIETLENKTLVSPLITGTLTFGNIPFYQYGHHGLSIFEDIDLSLSPLETVYNFGTPDTEKASVLALSVKNEYRGIIGTAGYNSGNLFVIGSTSNNTYFQIRKNLPIQGVDIVSGGNTLLDLNPSGTLRLFGNVPSSSYYTGTLVVNGGVGISGETYFNDNLHLLGGKVLKFYDNDYSNYIGLRSPLGLTSDYTFILPPNYGTNSQVLTTNGSGTLSFTTIVHNNVNGLQGGGTNYYHSDQPINVADSVQFAGLNINGAYSLPTVDGTNTQVITSNGSGTLSFTTINHNTYLSNIQGGGGGNYYHSDQPINTTNSVQFSGIESTKEFKLSGDSTITTSGSITSLSTTDVSLIRYDSTSQGTLHGLAGGVDGKIIIITNVNTGKLLLASESNVETTASNRIITQGDVNISVKYKSSIVLQYDSTSSRWRIINRHAHNDSSELQGGDNTNYYHSNQPINTTDAVTFNNLTVVSGINVSGAISFNNLIYPNTDGTNTQVLTSNGSGTLSFTTINHNTYLSNIQGGGGGNYYHSDQPINISNSVQFAGLNINGAYSFPVSDGTNTQVLTSNGSGTLSFTTINHNTYLSNIQGGGGGNYYHSDQPINTTNSVQFSGLNIGGHYSLPTVDGVNGQVPTTNGSGTLTFQDVLTDIVEDTTPQLGGDLDVNGFDIISVSNGNIDLSPNGTGRVNVNSNLNITGSLTVSNILYPTVDGSNRQVLATNGSGTLGFITLDSLYNFGNISSSSSLNLTNVNSLSYFTHTNASSSTITLTNGIIGKTYKVIGNSNGVQYSFSASGGIKWPSAITPIISNNTKSDLFVFECTGTNKYIGYYFYNYDTSGIF